LNEEDESLTTIAYKSEYYDQSHFIKDFKEFTGVSPREFLGEKTMALSTLFYKLSDFLSLFYNFLLIASPRFTDITYLGG
jgi:AraC-like DNA-binding protein